MIKPASRKKPRLQEELETFARLTPQLLAEAGMYAVIGGHKHIGNFDTWGDALKVGYIVRGLKPFLVKQIQPKEEVSQFSRPIVPCRT